MPERFLQLRRDALADFHSSNVVPLEGEPIWLSDDQRLKIGVAGPNAPVTGVYPQVRASMKEDIPYKVLWNIKGTNNANGANIPAVGLGNVANGVPNSRKTVWPVATGNVGDLTLQDTALIKGSMTGSFKTGSAEPSMSFAFGLNASQNTSPALIVTKGGTVHGENYGNATPLSALENNIRVSGLSAGENCLQYPEEFPWILEWEAHVLGQSSDVPYTTSGGATSNVTIHAKLTYGPALTRGNSLGHHSTHGPNLFTLNNHWSPEYISAGTRQILQNQVVVHHGIPYQAIFTHASLDPVSGTYAADYLTALSERQPGCGKYSQEYWYKLRHEMNFVFTEDVDIDIDGLAFTVYAGGAHQTDTDISFPLRSAFATAFPLSASTNATGSTIEHTDGDTYTVRRDMANNDTEQDAPLDVDTANPTGRWNRNWRLLAADRKDVMTVHSSVCYLVGGRHGVGGTLSE